MLLYELPTIYNECGIKRLINVRLNDNVVLGFMTILLPWESHSTFLSISQMVQVTCRLLGVILEESTPEELQVVTFIFKSSSIYEYHHSSFENL